MSVAAGAFGLGTMAIKGKNAGLEFFAGYIVEQSLSVDNLFIFIMLFDYFKVPAEFQVCAFGVPLFSCYGIAFSLLCYRYSSSSF